MEIKIMDRVTETQVANIIEATGGTYYLGTPGTFVFVALQGNEVIGFVELERMETVTLIYAKPGNIQAEVFGALLDAVEGVGFNRIILTVAPAAKNFFMSFGYKDAGNSKLVKILPKSHSFKTYEEVYEFIDAQKDRVYSLDNFASFMNACYNFQYGLPSIHICGTNGKGSTANYTKEVLKEAGYNVGAFTSPYLIHPLDIIKVDDKHIDEGIWVKIANRYMGDFLNFGLSKFEMEVFISIVYFYYRAIDLAIFEVGLGGLLDATNIIRPLLAINTNIGLDHVDYLGTTYEEIARNKAGIMKDDVDFMTAETRQECLDVFNEEALKHNSKVLQIRLPEIVEYNDETVEYHYHGHHIVLDTMARYQVTNSVLAINVLEYISKYFPYDAEDLEKGLKKAHWAGRFEKIYENPTVIIDGAHNKEGMEAFYNTVKDMKNIKIIYSALRDKDTHHMIETLLKLTDDVTVTVFDHPRAASLEQLCEDLDVKKEEDWKAAIDKALTEDKTLFITGSLYFISKVRKYIIGE